MADEIITPPAPATPTEPVTPPAPVTPAAQAFTQDQVNAAAAAARRASDAKVAALQAELESFKAKVPAASPAAKPDPATPVTTADIASIVAREVSRANALSAAIKGASEGQESILRALYAAEATPPEDVAAWAKGKKEAMGINTTSEVPAAPVQPGKPTPAPIAPSAPSVTVPTNAPQDILGMDASQIHEMIRKGGGNAAEPYNPKNRAPRREIRIATLDAVAKRTLFLPK